MDIMPTFVDMAKTPEELKEEKTEGAFGQYDPPLYPYGLCISLTQEELDKLDMEDDVEVGDMIHIHALGKVTSVNKRELADGVDSRIEIQLTHIAAEDEDEENEEAEEAMPHKLGRGLYK